MNASNADKLWDEARHIYSIGLLTLGTVFVILAIILLCVLPACLRVARQFTEAIRRHAAALEKGTNHELLLQENAADVKAIKADVELLKKVG